MWIQILFPLLVVAAAALLIRALVVERLAVETRARTVVERVALATAVALALLPSLVLFIVPIYAGYTEHVTESGGLIGASTAGSTLVQANGLRAVLPLVLPLVLTVTPLVLRASRFRRSITRVAAVLLTVFVVLGSFSIGLLYLPSAVALWVAAWGARLAARTA
ncbi:MAG: hypothetical protein Q8K82_15465 [Gemmatimonadaceae bacterium]|nr:hypothetical protein [Gemmatimonadaceae bacterium]